MSFDLPATSYDRFMGRYSAKLAPPFCEFAAIRVGQRVLDVGCGPGALTGELIGTVGHEAVTAVDPSGPFVTAARSRYPGVDVWLASAEELPFSNGMFDATCAQLVVHFMADPVAGLAEMARVTRPAGRVVASVGTTRAIDLRSPRSGRQLARSALRTRTNRASPVLGAAIARSCSARRGSIVPRKRNSPSVVSTRASTTGGRRSPSGSDPRAPMLERWATRNWRACGTGVASSSATDRSR